MTGPEHYHEAENLLNHAAGDTEGSDIERYHVAAAQVHATLALAAATALNLPHPDAGFNLADMEEWEAAAAHPGKADRD